MLSIGLWRWYINISITNLDIIHRPIFYLKLNSIGFSVPHRKHITSPLRAQKVNAIYRFVMTVYKYNYRHKVVGLICILMTPASEYCLFILVTAVKPIRLTRGKSGINNFKWYNNLLTKTKLWQYMLGRCGRHNRVTEDDEIDFRLHGNTGWRNAQSLRTLQSPQWAELQHFF
jgi:hypothetical protein